MTSRGLLWAMALSLVMWLLIAALVVRVVHAQEIGTAVACGPAGCTERPQLLADVQAEAEAAEVEPIHLLGAMNSLWDAGFEVGAHDYLHPPVVVVAPSNGWPIGGALGQRIYCIEGIESRHGAAMYNPMPWHGEHAQGWLGYLPSTARSVGVTIGIRSSEWDGAAWMLAHGRGREFYGVGAGIC